MGVWKSRECGAECGQELNCREGARQWNVQVWTGRALECSLMGSAFSEVRGKVIAESKACWESWRERSRCVPQCGRKGLTSQV